MDFCSYRDMFLRRSSSEVSLVLRFPVSPLLQYQSLCCVRTSSPPSSYRPFCLLLDFCCFADPVMLSVSFQCNWLWPFTVLLFFFFYFSFSHSFWWSISFVVKVLPVSFTYSVLPIHMVFHKCFYVAPVKPVVGLDCAIIFFTFSRTVSQLSVCSIRLSLSCQAAKIRHNVSVLALNVCSSVFRRIIPSIFSAEIVIFVSFNVRYPFWPNHVHLFRLRRIIWAIMWVRTWHYTVYAKTSYFIQSVTYFLLFFVCLPREMCVSLILTFNVLPFVHSCR